MLAIEHNKVLSAFLIKGTAIALASKTSKIALSFVVENALFSTKVVSHLANTGKIRVIEITLSLRRTSVYLFKIKHKTLFFAIIPRFPSCARSSIG